MKALQVYRIHRCEVGPLHKEHRALPERRSLGGAQIRLNVWCGAGLFRGQWLKEADRLQRLLIQLLKLARADEGKSTEHESGMIDLREVTQEVATQHVPPALEASIELHFGADQRPFPTRANPMNSNDLGSNLIDIAIRYQNPGGSVGSGLGLAIVQWLAAALNPQISMFAGENPRGLLVRVSFSGFGEWLERTQS